MKLHVGERLPGAGPPSHPGGYEVTGVVAETTWYGLYTARKIYYNFDFQGKRLREADENEWLEVYLRTINYPRLDDAEYVTKRRARARAEARRILGNRTSNLWPEPLDLLEIPNTRDPFTFGRADPPPGGAAESGPPTPGALSSLDPRFSQLVGTEPVLVFARPQGEPLARWRQKIQPLAWVLGVLAELLEFIQAAHGDGLLLNGLGPGAVLVDPVGRVHYLGTDMVVELEPGTQLAIAGAAAGAGSDWTRLFPPERYPRGFAAPECFDPARPRDRRTDLYGWATIAYFLLTGDRPPQLALNQGQAWARFEEPQFARLERALRSIPPIHARNWAEQLGVDGEVLVQGWPRNLLSVLRLCLRADPTQRPGSVADVRAWLMTPPPPPVPVALAVRPASDQPVNVYLDIRDINPSLTVVVRRGIGFQPMSPDEGELVVESPPAAQVVDADWMMPVFEEPDGHNLSSGSSVHYAVFTRASRDGRVTFSAPTVAELVVANPVGLRRCAEGGAAAGTTEEPEPARVRLLFEVFEPKRLAEVLLGSPLPQVRGWAVSRLARLPRTSEVQTTFWRCLKDETPAIRLEAARALLESLPGPSAALVRQVAEAIGGRHTDDAVQAAWSLRQVGVAEEAIHETIAALERDRPSACPECGLIFRSHERVGHLVEAHGYVDCLGSLLPRPEALARLWDQTFSQADRAAHGRLCELLAGTSPAPRLSGPTGPKGEASEPERPAYVAALEAQLHLRADGLLAARWQQLPRLVECLRASPAARPHFRHLLTSADNRVRDIGRELVLPEVAETLSGEDISPRDVRRELDALCPHLFIEEKIQLCLALPHAGVDAAAAEACLHELQAERPVSCSRCGGLVAAKHFETHLRRAHHIFQFRGVQRTLEDTLKALAAAVCGSSPDYEAWKALERITLEEFKDRADGVLTNQLAGCLGQVPEPRLGQVIASAAEAMAAAGAGPRFAIVLAETTPASPVLAHLALELATRLPVPLESATLAAVRPLLSSKQLPAEVRLDATAAFLRTTGKTGPAAMEVLQALVGESGKARAIERLRELERRVGNSPAIDELCARLEEQIRMVCPRCSVQLRRPAMREHLWQEHRLVLDGRRVREPWRLIEDWLIEFRLEPDPSLLARCRELAQRLDAESGLMRLNQLILAHGIDDAEARRDLVAEAQRRRVSLCPHCYAVVVPRQEPPPAELSVWRGRLSGRGYRVEVSDAGLVPWLEIETPGRVLFRGTEPPPRLTRKGALLLLAGIPALAGLVLSILLPALGVPALLPVAGTLALSLALGLFVSLRRGVDPPALDRAVDHAWQMLAPRLHEGGFLMEDSAFAAGLALASAGRGHRNHREESLKFLRRETETAVASSYGPVRHLAAFWRLTIEDMARADLDPVPVVVGQLGRCFDGKLPFTYAGQLLDRWQAPWWTAGALARLRVLLCDRAFEAGLEVQDLIEIGRVTPPLAAALKTDDVQGLGHLRLLWSLRPSRPWDRFGQTVSVFELAADPDTDRTRLDRYPDLLLTVEEKPVIHVCAGGIALLDEVFTQPPRSVEVVAQRPLGEAGFELVLDDRRLAFATDPEATARRLERLLRYFFHDFRSQVPAVLRWRSPAVSRTLRVQNAVPCPQCHQPVVVRLGDVGISMDVAGDLEPPARGKAV
jgi:hypothetical protein